MKREPKDNKMKGVVMFFIGLLLVLYEESYGVEVAPRITDKEIIESLAEIRADIKVLKADVKRLEKKLEEGQRQFREEQRQFREDMNVQFDRLVNIMVAIVAAFAGIVVVTIGFAVWDRRAMIRPFETKVKGIEEEITKLKADTSLLTRLLEALRELASRNKELAEILKKFNLL